jgi:hypothetical protein
MPASFSHTLPLHSLLSAGSLSDRDQQEAGNQGEGKALANLPGLSRPVPWRGGGNPSLGLVATQTSFPQNSEAIGQPYATHYGSERGGQGTLAGEEWG